MKKMIEVKNISKKYSIYHQNQAAYSTLVETWSNKARVFFDKICHPLSPRWKNENCSEEFWALDDVSFTVEEGDRVGVIGRNGSGKSTLLKILSRITEPTKGSIQIRGRVSSLLEVGTGFHPELTGRENIFLNGAILGLKNREIKQQFDEIVAFGEIEKFLDTPVKRYSSGMHARLGFAIAAHLDPDLLIVDEVLAVGDMSFQEKCLKKLNHLSSRGRTIIFVSHDIGSVMALCNKGVYLEKGRLKMFGPIEKCVSDYLRGLSVQTLMWEGVAGDEHLSVNRVYLESDQKGKEFFYQSEIVRFIVEYEVFIPSNDLVIGVGVWNQRNQVLARSFSCEDPAHHHHFNTKGKHRAVFSIDAGLFHEGEYLVKFHCIFHRKKMIVNDEVVLKFPIYASEKNVHFSNIHGKEGVFLGKHWRQLPFQ